MTLQGNEYFLTKREIGFIVGQGVGITKKEKKDFERYGFLFMYNNIPIEMLSEVGFTCFQLNSLFDITNRIFE